MYIDDMRFETPNNAGRIGSTEGLMLLHASLLKTIRLQLAIERQDRQAVLGAVDDLVALDRRLQTYLGSVPVTPQGLMLQRELDFERAAFNEEKLILGAEVLRRPSNMLGQGDLLAPDEADDDWLGQCDAAAEETEQPRRWRWYLAVILILAMFIAAAAYFIPAPDASHRLGAILGALR